MEDYPELKNEPGTPDYDEYISQLHEKWSAGVELSPHDLRELFEAHPELMDSDFEGPDAA